MSWKKCPRCEINYIQGDKELCDVCNPPVVVPIRRQAQAIVRPTNPPTLLASLKIARAANPQLAFVTEDTAHSYVGLEETEQRVMDGLKDFQRATVERVAKLFDSGIRRVLVADEVGLGKTLVARGVIAKTALLARAKGDDLFNVVYICSNSGIASQNIEKLKISAEAIVDTTNARLSMQHLTTTQTINAAKAAGAFIRLIPITPLTSLLIDDGDNAKGAGKGGTARERALMLVILRKMPELAPFENQIAALFIRNAKSSWGWHMNECEKEVGKCHAGSNGEYPQNIIERIRTKPYIYEFIETLKSGTESYGDIGKLRRMFASISIELLEPDLVIMDEFQRFKSLLSYQDKMDEDKTEADTLCEKMFGGETQILLLSATPYKLYSTIDEIEDRNADEHYSEFMTVLNFLFDNSPERMGEFRTVWSNYTVAVKEFSRNKAAVVTIKDRAEAELFSHIARTERGSENDAIDDSAVRPVEITADDIATYIEMTRAFESVDLKQRIHEDYIKSCPYPLSFMRDYKLKKNFEAACLRAGGGITAKLQRYSRLLWLDENLIRHYRPLTVPNARFVELQKKVFEQNAQKLLWVPPSRPYYDMKGVYEGAMQFTKTLVFSAWEMVPRMISTLLSYEAERRLRDGENIVPEDNGYFVKKRKPGPLLTYKVNKSGEVQTMSLFTLMYPSKYLADIYNPIEYLNRGVTDAEVIKAELKERIAAELEPLTKLQTEGRDDQRWYYLAPMLIDFRYDSDALVKWIADVLYTKQDDDKDTEDDDDSGEGAGRRSSELKQEHLTELQKLLDETKETLTGLGMMPDDLAEVLVESAMGSFAVCAMRVFDNPKYAFEIAEILRKRFNLPEATAIVTNNSPEGEVHWRSVLRYCINGNLQAMLDEYYHVLYDAVGKAGNIKESIYKRMAESFALHSATPRIDTFAQFTAKMAHQRDGGSVGIRTHFAVSFSKDADDQKHIDRKNSLRNAFNSPMWPFVLATTSIGQEGLDFHNYCRRIVHWNLPSNPIDLEQREGRINRYKCLAVRQSIAENFGNITFESYPWVEMFDAAAQHKQADTSDLFPFWRLGELQTVKIERIVPQFPLSKDILRYERLIKILSLYRLSLGQPRQEEFIESILKDQIPQEELDQLFINLSPFFHIGKNGQP